MTGRVWLDVPYSDKDAAKAAGARWDGVARRWYAPRPGMTGLEAWSARPEVPALLPGEDRGYGTGLFVDLVPRSCWFTNVRSCVSGQDWERLRRMLRARAGQRCEICGHNEDQTNSRRMDAHERWTFDEATETQKLVRLVWLCEDCHRATHFGLAEIRGQGLLAFQHLMAATGMDGDEADRHIDDAFAVWADRSRRTWHLDLTMLTDAGITAAPPPDATQRTSIADSGLRTARRT